MGTGLAEAQASRNSAALTELDSLENYLEKYDRLLAAVQFTPKMDHSVEIAEIDEILSQLTLQVKSLYDRQEIRFFDATGASLRTQRSSQTLLLAVSAAVLETRTETPILPKSSFS